MRSLSPIQVVSIAIAALVAPFAILWLYMVLLLRADLYLPHADLAFYTGLALSLAVGLVFFWQLPLRPPGLRLTSAALYLVCLTPLLMILAIVTVCHVSGKCM